MPSATAFTIKYWGTTGSYAAPLRPADVAARLRDAVLHLAKQRQLEALVSAAANPARLEHFLQAAFALAIAFDLRWEYDLRVDPDSRTICSCSIAAPACGSWECTWSRFGMPQISAGAALVTS